MKRSLSLLFFAAMAVNADPPYIDPVSRAGKNVKFLLQVSGAGASTPQVLFNKAKNPAEEPTLNNFLTPLGQRQ